MTKISADLSNHADAAGNDCSFSLSSTHAPQARGEEDAAPQVVRAQVPPAGVQHSQLHTKTRGNQWKTFWICPWRTADLGCPHQGRSYLCKCCLPCKSPDAYRFSFVCLCDLNWTPWNPSSHTPSVFSLRACKSTFQFECPWRGTCLVSFPVYVHIFCLHFYVVWGWFVGGWGSFYCQCHHHTGKIYIKCYDFKQ